MEQVYLSQSRLVLSAFLIYVSGGAQLHRFSSVSHLGKLCLILSINRIILLRLIDFELSIHVEAYNRRKEMRVASTDLRSTVKQPYLVSSRAYCGFFKVSWDCSYPRLRYGKLLLPTLQALRQLRSDSLQRLFMQAAIPWTYSITSGSTMFLRQLSTGLVSLSNAGNYVLCIVAGKGKRCTERGLSG